MSMLTFKEKFLALPSDKRAAIWEYCTLYSDSDLPPDMLTERISNIWENAADDPELLAYLEYVDYFCANVDEDECLDGDKRAYLGEYLSAKVDFLPRDSDIPLADLETDSLMDPPTETESLLLECPNKDKGFVTVRGKRSGRSSDSDSLKNWVCSQCGNTFDKHKIIDSKRVLGV